MSAEQPNFFDLVEKCNLSQTVKAVFKRGQILKVEISNSFGKWRIELGLPEFVNRNEFYLLSREIKSIWPQINEIEFLPRYPKWQGEVKEGIEYYWPQVKEVLAMSPVLNGWMGQLEMKVRASEIDIFVPNKMGKDIIESRDCPKLISKMYLEEIGLEVKVNVSIKPKEDTESSDWQEFQRQEEIKHLVEERIKSEEHKGNKVQEITDENSEVKKKPTSIIKGRLIKDKPVLIKDVIDEEKSIIIQGLIFALEVTELRSGRKLVTFDVTDLTDSITCKFFEDSKEPVIEQGELKKGLWVKVKGPVQFDRFANNELTLMSYDINLAEFDERHDYAQEKRVELHAHTKMSAMDGIVSVSDLIKTAAKWGHQAIAITDHGTAQGFPEADEVGREKIKVIYGIEGYLIDDGVSLVTNPNQIMLKENTYVVLDLETTGLSPRSGEIIEIAAVKCNANGILDEFATFVRPNHRIPAEVIRLTGITNDMVENSPTISQALPKLRDFIGDSVIVAHNATFDMGFLQKEFDIYFQTKIDNSVIDTLTLGRVLYPERKNHRLKTLAKLLGVKLENHHRAIDDALATAQIFLKMLKQLMDMNVENLEQMQALAENVDFTKLKPYHIILLARNLEGLTNLYQLISKSHLEYFFRTPRIPRRELVKHREGLILGSACEAGELIQAYLQGVSDEKLEEIASFYDYLEIQPVDNNRFMLTNGQAKDYQDLININKKIVEIGEKLNIPVVATGDVHFLNPDDEVYRRILMASKGFDDADEQAPLYFRTTEEMLDEFKYLGSDKAVEVVVKNPNMIADQIEQLIPMPDGFYPPQIDGAEQEISDLTYQTAHWIYGETLPDIVQKRIDKELNSIISNGFSVLYLIAQKLVKKSNLDGYLVGSRGSVGSSFVATMTGITEVNPLPPHYVCPKCKHSFFIEDGSYGSGADLPDKKCEQCGSNYRKDGHDIPFEVFLGFKGDKVPDIDLNFSGDYQSDAMAYTEELFGKGYVYRAGTIGTVAEKTAYGFAKKYFEERSLVKRNAELNRIVRGCTGVKRTTGQHPGGVMVVPRDKDVHDFTPLQYPADDKSSGTITTHFDYHSISGRIVKLDILGHDDPTVIRMLEDLTGVDAKTIPLDDSRVLELFSSPQSLGVTIEQIRSKTGTYGIPEFGTKFVRQMLEDTKPKSFSECVRISGFSHGTDVWLTNAQELIKAGTCTLSEAISTRDDIMVYLIYQGVEPSLAFKIMESVRKGKGIKPEWEEAMKKEGVPEWYIGSCKKIKYMFPKAHAVAYVMMAFRIAWFKVYHPEAFYATYFTVRADEFDADIIVQGPEVVKEKIEEIETKGNDASTKEKNLQTVLELALEMYMRDIKLKRVSIKESHSNKFLITDTGLLPPFSALQGVGETAANHIMEARQEQEFTSIEDLRVRARLSKTVIEVLNKHQCLLELPQTAQLELF